MHVPFFSAQWQALSPSVNTRTLSGLRSSQRRLELLCRSNNVIPSLPRPARDVCLCPGSLRSSSRSAQTHSNLAMSNHYGTHWYTADVRSFPLIRLNVSLLVVTSDLDSR